MQQIEKGVEVRDSRGGSIESGNVRVRERGRGEVDR